MIQTFKYENSRVSSINSKRRCSNMKGMEYTGNRMSMSNCKQHLCYTFVIRWREEL